jgi:hypothetical protein
MLGGGTLCPDTNLVPKGETYGPWHNSELDRSLLASSTASLISSTRIPDFGATRRYNQDENPGQDDGQ